MKTKNTDVFVLNKNILRIAIGTVLILLIPLIAKQFTSEVNWDETDFVIMGSLIFVTGLAYELITKRVDKRHRVAVSLVLAMVFLWLWAELAVGIFTNWGS